MENTMAKAKDTKEGKKAKDAKEAAKKGAKK